MDTLYNEEALALDVPLSLCLNKGGCDSHAPMRVLERCIGVLERDGKDKSKMGKLRAKLKGKQKDERDLLMEHLQSWRESLRMPVL